VRAARDRKLAITGSILEHLPDHHCAENIYENSHIHLSDARVIALRGKLTLAGCRGVKGSPVLGDPGLLVPRWIRQPTAKYDLGILPHFKDDKLWHRFSYGHRIDPLQSPENPNPPSVTSSPRSGGVRSSSRSVHRSRLTHPGVDRKLIDTAEGNYSTATVTSDNSTASATGGTNNTATASGDIVGEIIQPRRIVGLAHICHAVPPLESGNCMRTRHTLAHVLGSWCKQQPGSGLPHPPARCPNGHPLGPNQVLVGHVACLGHGGGHTSWHCRACDAVVFGPPLNTHCTTLEGPATVRISTHPS
jgi:hypothetical protein